MNTIEISSMSKVERLQTMEAIGVHLQLIAGFSIWVNLS
jgi:hypothetical protein